MSKENNEGDLRIAYIPQIPGKPYLFPVTRWAGSSDAAYLERAAEILEAVIGLSIFEFANRIKPDYADYAAIERWEDGEWLDVEEDEYGVSL